MRKGLVTLVMLIIFLTGGRAGFAEGELGKNLEKEVFRLGEIIKRIEEKLVKGEEILKEREAVREIKKKLGEIDGKLGLDFQNTEKRLKEKGLGEVLLGRHYLFVLEYENNLGILNKIINLIEKTTQGEKLEAIVKFAREKLPSLKPVKVRVREVLTGEEGVVKKPKLRGGISPAYEKGGLPKKEDLEETLETIVTAEIKKLARELSYSPLAIYNYVKNKTDFEPYYGSAKGAQMTLLSRGGNDLDQASLLIALFRTSKIPARYVQGTIEVLPFQATSQMGVREVGVAGSLFASGGTPGITVKKEGVIKKFFEEHIWVEAYLKGKWVALDPSFKEYKWEGGRDIAGEMGFEPETFFRELSEHSERGESYIRGLDGDYLKGKKDEYEENLKDYLEENPGLERLWGRKEIVKTNPRNLPRRLPYNTLVVSGEYAEVPHSLRNRVKFSIYTLNSQESLSYSAPLPFLAGKKLTLSYEPAREEDSQVLAEYGGWEKVPAYLVKVKPVLKLEERAVAEGQEEGLGSLETLVIEFREAGGEVKKVARVLTRGMHLGLGIKAGRVSGELLSQRIKGESKDLGELLYSISMAYFLEVDVFSALLAQIAEVEDLVVPPSLVKTSRDFLVGHLFSSPYLLKPAGFSIDILRDTHSPFSRRGNFDKKIGYTIAKGILISTVEHKIFEQLFGVPAISTAKVFLLANERGEPIYTLNAENHTRVIPKLTIWEFLKEEMREEVRQGRWVIVPENPLEYYSWKGTGYMIFNPEKGEGLYLISGKLAGGRVAEPGSISLEDFVSPKTFKSLGRLVDNLLNLNKERLLVPLVILASPTKNLLSEEGSLVILSGTILAEHLFEEVAVR
jgi:hypothetical protein